MAKTAHTTGGENARLSLTLTDLAALMRAADDDANTFDEANDDAASGAAWDRYRALRDVAQTTPPRDPAEAMIMLSLMWEQIESAGGHELTRAEHERVLERLIVWLSAAMPHLARATGVDINQLGTCTYQDRLCDARVREAGFGAAPAAIPMAVILPAAAPADADAALIETCEQHIANHHAFNARGADRDIPAEQDPLWLAYCQTSETLAEARPQTVAGIVAKARVAKVAATLPDGTEIPEHGNAATMAWDVLNDLLRLSGQVAS